MSKVHKYGAGGSGARDGAAPNSDAASADSPMAGAKPGTIGAYDRPNDGASAGKRRFPGWAIGLVILAAIVILYVLFFRGHDAAQQHSSAATIGSSHVAALLVTGGGQAATGA
jgi:hypothetical protein